MLVSTKKARLIQPRKSGRGYGFTLIEILIVIGITMLLTAIVLGGITRMGATNRRMTCQSNLSQIYQACRLYQQDEGGFPFYDDGNLVAANPNIGLWALYTFPVLNTSTNKFDPSPAGPFGRYIRSNRVFHCPQDNDPLQMAELNMLSSDDSQINVKYLSYQRSDPDDGLSPYKSVRTTAKGDADWERQMIIYDGSTRIDRAPADNTIVTWCPYHRKAVGGRDFDNVLYYDGSVQLLPRQQDDGSTGWKRLPKSPQ